jgi:hypothetical protein
MQLVTYAQRLFCVFGLGLMLSACGSTTDPPAATTYADVYTQMKSACGSCHTTGGVAAKKFIIDAASSANTYNTLMTAMLINKASPDASPLIVVGKGGTYTPAAGGTVMTHPKSLTDGQATSWSSWITAGANQ